METFEVLLLGCGAALPAYGRYPSAQLINIHEELFLVDCGECTQFQLMKYKIKRSRIHNIFITHLHGDHIFGLPGLITTYNLLDRKDPLHIYGPPGIEEMILKFLAFSAGDLNYDLKFHTITDFNGAVIYENEKLKVRSLPLFHKIPTTGYLFEEKLKKKKLDLKKIEALGIPVKFWKLIESGEDIVLDEKGKIDNAELIIENRPIRKYAYCSDTRYHEALIPFLVDVNLLYHETTYLDEYRTKAYENGHSTALQAAQLALKCGAKKLLTGHYSSRYEDTQVFAQECSSIFDQVVVGMEGLKIQIE